MNASASSHVFRVERGTLNYYPGTGHKAPMPFIDILVIGVRRAGKPTQRFRIEGLVDVDAVCRIWVIEDKVKEEKQAAETTSVDEDLEGLPAEL